MKKILAILTFFLSILTNAQTEERSNSLSVDFFKGIIIEHDSSLKTAIQGNPFGVLLSYNYVKNEQSDFNNLYNYPERGYSLLYEDFNSDILGEVVAVHRHYGYRLNPKKKNNLSLTAGFGLAYATKKFEEEDNPFNFSHGSHVLVSAFFKLQYVIWMLNNQMQLNSGILINHYSNISFKNPNLGSNSLVASIGIKHFLSTVIKTERTAVPKLSSEEKKWNFGIVIRGGYNESREPNSGLYPFYTLTGFAHKKVNSYSSIVAGLDFIEAKFLEHYIPIYNEQEKTKYNTNLTKRAGVFVGHELTQHNFAFVTQIGYTFYYPFPYISPIYERFGFKYNLGANFLAEVTMRVNLFRAESLEFGIGYQF